MNMLYLILFRYVEDENEEVLNPYGGDYNNSDDQDSEIISGVKDSELLLHIT